MFKIHSTDDGRICPVEYIASAPAAVEVGMALVVDDNGALAICPAAQKPQYISMRERTGEESGEYAVIRVGGDVIYETQSTKNFDGIFPGKKVTISADGLSVEPVTENGVAEVVSIYKVDKTYHICVRF